MRWLVLLLLLVLAGCSETGNTAGERAEAGLVFRRADGSEVQMAGRPLVWCGPWNFEEIPARSLHVAALGGLERKPDQDWVSYWRLWAIVEDVRGGKPVRFPNNFVWNRPRRAELFVGDFEGHNEASTKQENSGGQVVFGKVSCELGAPVSFEIHARIGSEFGDGDPISVDGEFSGVVGEAPPGFAD